MQTKIPKIIEGAFHEVINNAFKEKRHVDYLKNALKKYEEYKKFFEKVFIEIDKSSSGYIFRADYLSKKPVWRDIIISGNQTLEDLAEAIVFSMDWENNHMHGFGFSKGPINEKFNFFTSPYTIYAPGWEDDPSPTYKINQVKISQIDWKVYPKIQFVFDFGDGRLFNVVLKKTVSGMSNELEETFPQLIDQRGVAPEQYPELEDDESEEELESGEWFHEDCRLCKDLKNQGSKLQWFTDHPHKNTSVN